MTSIVWDEINVRIYESGLEKGVLYLPDGIAVPWNGLVSINEKINKQSTPIYYDGSKINDIVYTGEFSAVMKAITYPDEFRIVEGLSLIKKGIFLGEQKPKRFGLCYRTNIGSELGGSTIGYKLHIIYNLLAIPVDKTYLSVTSDPNVTEFEWNITAVPEEIPGFIPTAHIILNSLDVDPWLLEDLEAILYGTDLTSPALIPILELVSFIMDWYRVKIIDNGNGTWTAISRRDGFISLDELEQLFTITNVNATYLNSTTYTVSDTVDISEMS